jgi:arginine-tRNA-protein transferase
LLQSTLLKNGIESKILKYEFFDANLIPELEGIVLFDFPVFLACAGLSMENAIVFDIRDQQYHWVKCKSVWASTTDTIPNDIYSSHVLKFDCDLFWSDMPELMAATLMNELKLDSKAVSANLEQS